MPRSMGKEVQKEFQKALNEWNDAVFSEGTEGYLKDKRTQKIEMEEY